MPPSSPLHVKGATAVIKERWLLSAVSMKASLRAMIKDAPCKHICSVKVSRRAKAGALLSHET